MSKYVLLVHLKLSRNNRCIVGLLNSHRNLGLHLKGIGVYDFVCVLQEVWPDNSTEHVLFDSLCFLVCHGLDSRLREIAAFNKLAKGHSLPQLWLVLGIRDPEVYGAFWCVLPIWHSGEHSKPLRLSCRRISFTVLNELIVGNGVWLPMSPTTLLLVSANYLGYRFNQVQVKQQLLFYRHTTISGTKVN